MSKVSKVSKVLKFLLLLVIVFVSLTVQAMHVEDITPYVGKYVMIDYTDWFGFNTYTIIGKIIKVNEFENENILSNSVTYITLNKKIDNILLPLIFKVTEINIEDYI